jgi:hypothetical protein
MTQFELLKAAASLLHTLEKNEIDAKDVKYLQMYGEYKRLKEEGHKVGYVAYYLSQQYECSVATIYRVAKRMEKDIS